MGNSAVSVGSSDTKRQQRETKRCKNGYKSKKPPSVNAGDRPSGLADDSASLGFGFSFFRLVVPSRLVSRQAHATVPKLLFFFISAVFSSKRLELLLIL